MVREKRQHDRVRVGFPVMVRTASGTMVGQIKDISPGGAFLCVQESLNPEETLKMTIRFSRLRPPLKATGKVIKSHIYCLDDETMCHGMSVRFIKISDKDRKFLSALGT